MCKGPGDEVMQHDGRAGFVSTLTVIVFLLVLFFLQDSRTERVDSWRDFQQKGSKKKKKKTVGAGGLKPPKLKQEKR